MYEYASRQRRSKMKGERLEESSTFTQACRDSGINCS